MLRVKENPLSRSGLVPVACLLACGLLAWPTTGHSQETRPIDRWLLSRSFPAASVPEEGVLPTLGELDALFLPTDSGPPPLTQLQQDLARADSLRGPPPPDPNLPVGSGTSRLPPARRPPPQRPQGPLRPSWQVRRDSVLFPERGTRVGATIWTLLRQDGDPIVDLDGSLGRSGGTVTFATAYLRPPAERTVLLTLSGLGCTDVKADLNLVDVPLPEAANQRAACEVDQTVVKVPVRLAAGWNMLLLRVEGDAEPYGFAAELDSGPDGEPVDDIRIQASRPPGIRPIAAEPWVDVMELRVPTLAWDGDDLLGEVAVEFRLWGGGPPVDARVEVEIGGDKVSYRFEGEETGRPEAIDHAFPFRDLRRAALGEQVQLKLEWDADDGEREMTRLVSAESLLRRLHRAIELVGWEVPEGRPFGPRPPADGETLSGEWKVPGWLAGFTLELDVSGAPGTYTLNGEPLAVESGSALLCSECQKGERLELEVQTTDAWDAWPVAKIVGPTYADAAAAADSPPASAYLRALDDDGSASYRELLGEFASGGD